MFFNIALTYFMAERQQLYAIFLVSENCDIILKFEITLINYYLWTLWEKIVQDIIYWTQFQKPTFWFN